MATSSTPRRRGGVALAALLLLLAFGGLARSLSTLPARRAAAHDPLAPPFDWRRVSAPVVALERLLDAHRDTLARGAPVLVVARSPDGSDATFVGHWAQYFAPQANFRLAEDVGPSPEVELVLTFGAVAPAPEWRRLGEDSGFALFEVRR
ncbi:MAG: hypothetical protein H6511_02130 [Holophagales bacterium]|nr:hypothetical protein [Holophagales bacterium]